MSMPKYGSQSEPNDAFEETLDEQALDRRCIWRPESGALPFADFSFRIECRQHAVVREESGIYDAPSLTAILAGFDFSSLDAMTLRFPPSSPSQPFSDNA